MLFKWGVDIVRRALDKGHASSGSDMDRQEGGWRQEDSQKPTEKGMASRMLAPLRAKVPPDCSSL